MCSELSKSLVVGDHVGTKMRVPVNLKQNSIKILGDRVSLVEYGMGYPVLYSIMT